MKICRFEKNNQTSIGFYDIQSDSVVSVQSVADAHQIGTEIAWQSIFDLTELLPIGSLHWALLQQMAVHAKNPLESPNLAWHESVHSDASIRLLPPVGRPPKLMLLAGNYREHVLEQGGVATEHSETFPYVFMKPASTSLIGSGEPFSIPKISPNKIDYELELAVIIGRDGFEVSEEDALEFVAGYTIVNDISDRGFRPNTQRVARPRDRHFDWSHGKWHPGSCPCGPCFTSADEIPNPQTLSMRMQIDGGDRQNASTELQIFSVAQIISFISSWLPLEPGDMICTGTPAGVGNASGRFLMPGQLVEGTIEQLGTLRTPIL